MRRRAPGERLMTPACAHKPHTPHSQHTAPAARPRCLALTSTAPMRNAWDRQQEELVR